MPIETGLQPRINHAPSEQHRLIKSCMSCGVTSPRHLIETFIVSMEASGKSPSVARKELCGPCLVGHDVAVLRPSCNDWCFGGVLDYDSSQLHPFLVCFADGRNEWTKITPTPSKDYLKYIGIGLPETTSLPTTTTDQNSSIGTFYSSSMSSMSSFDQAHAFPLFDDENLIHLDSFSSLEDSTFADKEVVPPAKRVPKDSRTRVRPKNPNARASGVPWTAEEDKQLLAGVEVFKKSDKKFNWTSIAKECPKRNGKQCRERYMNHLSSALIVSEWSPREDSILFTSFFRTGKSWCKIAKVLSGRTDNAIKNRFHHIKRRINKDLRRKVQKYSSMISPHVEAPPADEDSADAILQKTRKLLNVLAAESKRRDTFPYMKGYIFGPFIPVTDEVKMCPRCGLFIPSVQTGDALCTKTKWCKACTMMPPYVAHDMLRECLEMRRDGN